MNPDHDYMAGVYERKYKEIHWTLRHALEARGLTHRWYDGKTITRMHKEGDITIQETVREALAHLAPRHRTEELATTLERDMNTLIRLGGRIGHLSAQDIAATETVDCVATSSHKAVLDADLCTKGVDRKLITKWRRVKELAAPDKEPAFNQRDLEAELCKRWRARILAHFTTRPEGHEHLLRALGEKDRNSACHDLFGVMRHTTLAALCRALEAILRIDPQFIPWDTTKIANLYNTIRTMEVNANKPFHWHKCIKKLGCILGRPYPDEDYLRNKLDTVRAQLATTTARVDKRALAPGTDVPESLERATREAHTPALQWVAAALRFCLGASARVNDCQHTSPSTRYLTKTTVEFHPWQTKVSSFLFNNRPMPLIAPLHTYSGVEWWNTFNEGLDAMSGDTFMRDRDFLIPELSRDHSAFRKRPANNSRLLKLYRSLMVTGGLPREEAVRHSLPGLRVFMAEQAYQAGIPRDQRRYIGRWASDQTADVYTREHRSVILNIWQQVMKKGGTKQTAHVPEDLTAPYYDLGAQDTGPGSEAVTDADGARDPKTLKGITDQIEGDLDPAVTDAEDRSRQGGPETTSAPRLPLKHRTHADLVPTEQGGPLLVYVMNNDTGTPPTRKCHLVMTRGTNAGKTAGCGRRLLPSKCRHIEDYATYSGLAGNIHQCAFCFRAHALPSGWGDQPPGASEGAETSSSALSTNTDTEEESDTESDDDAVVITKKPKTESLAPPAADQAGQSMTPTPG